MSAKNFCYQSANSAKNFKIAKLPKRDRRQWVKRDGRQGDRKHETGDGRQETGDWRL